MKLKQIHEFHEYIASKLEITPEHLLTYTITEIKAELKKIGTDLKTVEKEYNSSYKTHDIDWRHQFTFHEKNSIYHNIEKYQEALLETNVIHFNIGDKNVRVTVEPKRIIIEKI